MIYKEISLEDLIETTVDNRGRSCPITDKDNEYLPLIATNCITDRLYPEFLKVRSVSKEIYDTWFRGHPIPGDIIFVNKGTPGKVALVPEKVDFCIAQDMVALRVKKDYYSKYIFAVLRSEEVRKKIENMHVGTLIPHFKKGDFKTLKLSIIQDYYSQKKIGDFYFSILEKIEVNFNQIKKLEEISQQIFKNWFIDFEFPNEQGLPFRSSGGEMVESKLGEIPKGWSVVNIEDVCDSNKESISKKDEWGYLYYLDTGNITRNAIDELQFIDVTNAKVPSRAKRKVKPNDIIFSTVRPNQEHHGLIKVPVNNMVVSTGFTVLTSKGFYPNDLVYLWLIQENTMKSFQAIAEQSTSAYPSLKPDDILKHQILLPPEDILINLGRLVEKNHSYIWQLQQENKKLTELRDTLLRRLLSGEIEIPDESVAE